MVSILGDYSYSFPPKQLLKLKLKDMLEDNVDEKYYLSDKTLEQIFNWNSYQNPLDNVLGKESISPTITTRIAESQDGGINASMKVYCNKFNNTTNLRTYNKSLKETLEQNEIDDTCYIDTYNKRIDKDKSGTITTGVSFRNNTFLAIKNATAKGYLEATDGDGIDISSRMEHHRGTVQKGKAQTLTTQCDRGVVLNDLRIRKLTPKECFRLMGVKDEDYEKVAKNQSNASLYHLAGDSLITTIMMALFSQMLDINWQKHFNSKEWWNNE